MDGIGLGHRLVLRQLLGDRWLLRLQECRAFSKMSGGSKSVFWCSGQSPGQRKEGLGSSVH